MFLSCSNFCSCATGDFNPELRDIQQEYWRLLDALVNVDGTYDQPERDDFTVVIQPQMRDFEPWVLVCVLQHSFGTQSMGVSKQLTSVALDLLVV